MRRPALYGASVGALTCGAVALLVLEGLPPRVGLPLAAAGAVLGLLATRPARRRAATRGAALLTVTCLASLAADVALRATIGRTLYDRPLLNFADRWPRDPALTRVRPHVQDERTVRGDLIGMLGDLSPAQPRRVRFATDAHGFRNDRAPARPLDVVLLGDSFGMGEGTTQDDTWAAHLARAGLEVHNLSYPGSPGTHVLNLAWEGPRLPLRPDRATLVVWALFAGNDLWESYPRRAAPLERAWPARLATALESYRTRSPLRRLVFERGAPRPQDVVVTRPGAGPPALFFRPYVERAALTLEELQREPRYPLLVESFGLMRRQADALGVRVLVVVIPSKAEVLAGLLGRAAREPTPFARLVRPLARGAGFDVLDLAPALRAAARPDTGPLLHWRDDTHWDAVGHAVAARALLERLVTVK